MYYGSYWTFINKYLLPTWLLLDLLYGYNPEKSWGQ